LHLRERQGAGEGFYVSKARHTSTLVALSAVLVLGGTAAMAGTVTPEPAAATSVVAVSQSRANADVRVNRSTDRLSQLARAKKLAAQQAAARKAALKRAAAKKAAAKKARIAAAKRAAARKAAAKKARIAAAKRAAARKAAAKRSSRSHVRSGSYPTSSPAKRYAESLVTDAQWPCLWLLWERESGWSPSSRSGSHFGIAQLRGETSTDFEVQVDHGLRYIKNRYGTPCNAWAHSQRTGWY